MNFIGADLFPKKITLNGRDIHLQIWDTAGSERHRSVTPSLYRDAHGVILVYDVTSRNSFQNLKYWLQEAESYINKPGVVKLLVGHKIDLIDKEVSRKEAMAWARQNKMLFIEASSKTGEEVNCAFEELVEKILETPGLLDNNPKDCVDLNKITNENWVSSCFGWLYSWFS